MVNFPTQIPDCDSHSPALLDLFISTDASICSKMAFSPLGNSDHVVASVSIDFPSNSQRDASFHCITYEYSHADWDGLCDYLRDVPWEDIFKLGASAAASEFCEWVQVGIDVYIPHRKYQVKPHSSPWFSAGCAAKNPNLDDSGISLPIFLSRTNLKLHNISVTPKMVKKVLMNLDLPQASGPDCPPVVVLKHLTVSLNFLHTN